MNDLLVLAQIGGRRCVLSAQDVQSVIEIGTVTPVPRAPDYVAGITAMRSQALTVIDCRRALGLKDAQWPLDHRAIVVTVDGYAYALRVDAIEDVTTGSNEASDVPGGFGREWAGVALGMVETRAGPAILLDVEAMIAGADNASEAA